MCRLLFGVCVCRLLFRRVPFVVRCLLFVVWCLVVGVCCYVCCDVLIVGCCLLLVVRCVVFVVRCLPFVFCRVLSVARLALFGLCWLLFVCLVCRVRCFLFNVC